MKKRALRSLHNQLQYFRFLYFFMLNTNVHDERLFKQEKSIHTKCEKPLANGQAAGSSVVCIQNV